MFLESFLYVNQLLAGKSCSPFPGFDHACEEAELSLDNNSKYPYSFQNSSKCYL